MVITAVPDEFKLVLNFKNQIYQTGQVKLIKETINAVKKSTKFKTIKILASKREHHRNSISKLYVVYL